MSTAVSIEPDESNAETESQKNREETVQTRPIDNEFNVEADKISERLPTISHQVLATVQFGYYPVYITCPHCEEFIVTDVQYIRCKKTWCASLVFAICTCCLCFWVPLVINTFKNIEHVCPKCGAVAAKVANPIM